MDHNWNLIPQIVDLLDGYFEIILLPFFLDIELKIWVPRAPLSSLNLIPISCIKNLDSAIISWARCCLLYWQHSNVLTHLLLFTPNPLSMDRPSTYALPSHLFLETSWWTFLQIFSTSSETTHKVSSMSIYVIKKESEKLKISYS